MFKININGRELTGHEGQTILQIARENEIHIPTMCYDERLETYGACGLCVVEIEGSPKLARSCATMAAKNMVVNTMSEKVIASRKTALELLMSDHVGDCKAPCMRACPGNTDCQGYVGLIANGMFEEAIKTIKSQLPMPASIGRVCPHPCETECRRQLVESPIAIAQLKYFAADKDLEKDSPYLPEIQPDTGKKVAIVGGGPGGLSEAYFLRTKGHDVTVFDAMPQMGGMLRYGIPEYRLPKSVVDQEIMIFEMMDIHMVNNVRLGKDITLDELRRDYDAVVIATGAWTSSPLGIKGMELEGVYGGIDFLRKVVLGEEVNIGERVAVVGGGNTAMDAVRTAVRLGAKEVYNVYRRTKQEMPAEEIEIIEAEEEGVIFKNLSSPIEVIGENGKVTGLHIQKMELSKDADASGRRRPIAIEGETEIIQVDSVLSAIGQGFDAFGHEGIELTDRGTIKSDEFSFLTNLEGVFAIGDATNRGADIAISAIGEAKRASGVIDSYLMGLIKHYHAPYFSINHQVTEEDFKHKDQRERVKMPHLAPQDRRVNFKEVNLGFSTEAAMKEGERCLECGCLDYYECDLIDYANDYDIDPKPIEGEKHYRSEERNHPFIMIDQDKCILCGQCVRTCDEVLGIGALGLVNRGFDTMMSPAFDLPLEETGCISCGQCVSLCPTGALQERLTMGIKQIPLPIEESDGVCNRCSIGCHLDIETKQGELVRVKSDLESPVDRGQLCVRGRFGHNLPGAKEILLPMVKDDHGFKVTSMEEAMKTVAKQVKAEDLTFVVSGNYTNEDYAAIKVFSENFGSKITSTTVESSPLLEITGVNGSLNSFEEIYSAEQVILVGVDLMEDYAVLGMNLRLAMRDGLRVISLNDRETSADEWMDEVYRDQNPALSFAKAVAQHQVQDIGTLSEVSVSSEISHLAKAYIDAKSAIIVFDGSSVSRESAAALAVAAQVSGKIGTTRRGIIELTNEANAQGLRDLDMLTETKLTGAIFSADQEVQKGQGMLIVQAEFYQDWMDEADVILPKQKIHQMRGTLTNAEGRIQGLAPLEKNETPFSLVNILSALSTAYEGKELKEMDQYLVKHVSGYADLKGFKNQSNFSSAKDFDASVLNLDPQGTFRKEVKKNVTRKVIDQMIDEYNLY